MQNTPRETPPAPVDWYFDIISPFAYLAWHRLDEIAAKRPVRLRPVVFAGFLKQWGQLGPAEIAPKRVHIYRQCAFMALQRGVPFTLPPQHPFSPLTMLRLLTALDAAKPAVAHAFHAVWGEGRDANSAEVLAEVAQAGGDPGALECIGDPAVKGRLAANGAEAIAAGVFGVPTLLIDGEAFWGYDAVDMALAFIDDPALFERDGIDRSRSLPVGVTRPR